AHDAAVSDDRHTLDPPLLHKFHDIGESGVFVDRRHVTRHDIRNTAAVGFHELVCPGIQVGEQFEPPGPLPLRAGFDAAHQVALGHDANQAAFPINDRHPADAAAYHEF